MSFSTADLSATVLEMRREFDLSFAQIPSVQNAKLENFLGIRFGNDAYAIRTSEIGGLYVDCRIMAMPTATPSFLGVAGFRGLIAPVYDLAKLLGYRGIEAPRWLVLVRLGEPVALAFDAFEAHFSAESSSIVKKSRAEANKSGDTGEHQFDAIRTETATRSLIHLPSLIETIRRTGNTSV